MVRLTPVWCVAAFMALLGCNAADQASTSGTAENVELASVVAESEEPAVASVQVTLKVPNMV